MLGLQIHLTEIFLAWSEVSFILEVVFVSSELT